MEEVVNVNRPELAYYERSNGSFKLLNHTGYVMH
jgi:hypothetical protein